jgi:HK97 family phage prohead protease
MPHEIERRSFRVELRASTEGRQITGYAAMFDQRSEELGGFHEVIRPGAFDRALKEGHDVRALWNHNPDLVLGRTKAGTLRLSVDDRGLKIEADLPETQAGRDAHVSIGRGDVDQMSFAFRVLTDEWRTENGEPLRELLDVELFDVSPVTYPAYQQTHVSARALQMALNKAIERPNRERQRQAEAE